MVVEELECVGTLVEKLEARMSWALVETLVQEDRMKALVVEVMVDMALALVGMALMGMALVVGMALA